MNVYILINDISKIGGLSRVALNLFREFRAEGYETFIVTGHLHQENRAYYAEAKEGIVNLELPSVHRLGTQWARVRWYAAYLRALRRLDVPEDAVFIGIETVVNMVALLSRKARKVIVTEHTAYRRRRVTQVLKRLLYPSAHRLVVLTQRDAAQYTEKMGLSNVTVIPNFVELPPRVSSLSHRTILFVGSLDKVKGADYLEQIISAFSLPGWRFRIVGEGPMKARLAGSLPKEKVVFAGMTSDMESCYTGADILVMTSRKEGFPMVLLEAKSFGLPIVAFDCETGPREIVRDEEDGFLVSPGDVNGFVEKLERLARDEALRGLMGQKARKNVREFSKEKVMRQWIDVLES